MESSQPRTQILDKGGKRQSDKHPNLLHFVAFASDLTQTAATRLQGVVFSNLFLRLFLRQERLNLKKYSLKHLILFVITHPRRNNDRKRFVRGSVNTSRDNWKLVD
jgi:hypothetical protein